MQSAPAAFSHSVTLIFSFLVIIIIIIMMMNTHIIRRVNNTIASQHFPCVTQLHALYFEYLTTTSMTGGWALDKGPNTCQPS